MATHFAFPLIEDLGICPVCASKRLTPLHLISNRGRLVTQAEVLTMTGCEACGVVFSNPLPSESDLTAYYTAQGGWEDRLSGSAEKIEKKLEKKRKACRKSRDLLIARLGVTDAGRQPRVLDYGCGIGAWLDVFQEAGWETYGFEPGTIGSETVAQRHHLVTDIPTEELFDLIILNHVLEHLRDPVQVLQALSNATLPGGHVYVSVPDLGRLAQHRDLGYVMNRVHIFSYTASAMGNLLGLAGFTVAEHLDQPEWDQIHGGRPNYHRCLARKTGTRAEMRGQPLRQAIENLRAYGNTRPAENGVARDASLKLEELSPPPATDHPAPKGLPRPAKAARPPEVDRPPKIAGPSPRPARAKSARAASRRRGSRPAVLAFIRAVVPEPCRQWLRATSVGRRAYRLVPR